MAAADSTPLLRERVDLVEQDKRHMAGIILTMQQRDSVNAKLLFSFQEQVLVLNEKQLLYNAELSNIRTLLKKERRKRTWTAIGGLVGIAGAFYLGTKL